MDFLDQEQIKGPLLEWLQSLDESAALESVDWWKILKILDFEFFQENREENVKNAVMKWLMAKYPKQDKQILKILQESETNLDLEFEILASLLLVIAVQSNSNEIFIEKMQQLSIETQISLKNIIQGIIQELTLNDSPTGIRDNNFQDEIRGLKLELDESSMKLQEKSEEIEKLQKQLIDFGKLKLENQDMKEMKQELEFLKEKHSKTELLLQKYKKKLDENQSVKGKEIEDLVKAKNNEISKLQEEARRDGLLKKMMVSYKEQITKLETGNSTLQVEKTSLSNQIMDLSKELCSVKESSQEQIKLLNDRIIEISNQKMDQGSELKGNTLDQDQRIEKLEAINLDSRQEISQLSDKMLVLENQLDDMTRLKNAFEQDYRKTLELNSRIQLENKELILKVEKTQDEDSLLQKLEIFQNSAQETAILNAEQAQTIKAITQQLQLAQEESRLKHGQVNSLLQEKESLVSKVSQLKERLNSTDQLLADTKSSIVSQDLRSQNSSPSNINSKLASATQKIVQLTDQNALLHQALRKAKNHILLLDKTIKDQKSVQTVHSDQNPYAEAIHSFETQLLEKTLEISRLRKDLTDLRESTKREEELMSSAWYKLCSTLQTSELDKLAGNSEWLNPKENQLL